MIIGVTGTIGSGKSTVCNILRNKGYDVIDADAIHHELMKVGNVIYNDVVTAFGNEILNTDRTINRAVLRNIIFNSKNKKEELERISFTHILDKMNELSEEKELVFWEVPLLFEAGWDKFVDVSIVVVANEATIVDRVMKRSNLSAEDVYKFINAQMPVNEKIKKANYVLENDTDMLELTRRVSDLINKIIDE